MEKLKVFEAFAGLGSQVMALKKLDINFESVGIAEIDKYADKAYKFIHGEINNYGDISKIDWNDVPYFDLFTYSFPCQDLSLAGKRKGLVKGSGTRSSLLWECEKAIEIKRPAYLLLENVKGLITEEMKPHFFEWLKILENLGYCNYWKVMNAKDYGIPQNRERVFVVSIRNDINLKRDILEPNMFERLTYEFPKPFDNGLRLKNMLESEVAEKYYLSDKTINQILNWKSFKNPFKDNLYYKNGNDIVNCIAKRGEDLNSGMKLIYENKLENIIPCQLGNSEKRGNFIGKNNQAAFTIKKTNANGIIIQNRIRRLTPLEVWRLFGFAESDYNKIRPHFLDTQIYKLCGNSIVVNCLELIFKNLFVKKH